MLVGDAELGEASATILRTNDPRDADVRIGAKNPIDSIGDGSGRDAGAYVLTVYAMWPQGGVSFYFPVEIVAGTSPTPSQSASVLTAVLEAPADGSMPGLVLTYAGRTQNFFAQDGRWPGVDAFPMPLLAFDASIDPGTRISIESDAEHVDGSLFIADRNQRETGESIPLDLTSGSATFPDSPGYFRLVLVGTWPRGEAGFNVGITIGTPPSDWPPSPSTATVPNVIGLEKHQAVSRLIDAGFEMVSVAVPAGQTGGVVTSQDPPPGSISETTTTIRLTVSASG
jgi:hypothetical protein